jgi:hypothetical protein
MRIIRNERFIRTRRALGQIIPGLALVVLVAGLVISFAKPEWFWATLTSVVVGLVLVLLGGLFTERYASPIAHHDSLASALKGLDDRHVLLQYVLPVPHVLLDPGGCTVLVVKSQPGQITYAEGRWNHRYRGKLFRQLAGQQGVGVPHVEAEQQVQKLRKWLARELPDTDVPIGAAIVFVNPKASVSAAQSPVPAFFGKKIKAWLRGPGRRKPLPRDEYRRLNALLDPSVTSAE